MSRRMGERGACALPAHLHAFFDARRKAALLAADLDALTGDADRAATVPLADADAQLAALDSTSGARSARCT